MEETKLEKLARLSGKVTSKALGALERRGIDVQASLLANGPGTDVAGLDIESRAQVPLQRFPPERPMARASSALMTLWTSL